MQKILLVFFLVVTHTAFTQKPEYIHFEPENVQISKSIFSTVEVIDTRFDTVYMGFVQKGGFNRKAPIKLAQPMASELQTFAAKATANAEKQNGTFLINIRNFFMSEYTGLSESGTFIFKAGCYWKKDDNYVPMFSVDTTVVVKSGIDVTKKLINAANKEVAALIQKAATFDTASLQQTPLYSFTDIANIDSLEKSTIPVYNVPLPERGLYATFEYFKNNQPVETEFTEQFNTRTGEPSFFLVKDDKKKRKEISRKDYYAICDGKQAYISTEYGIYPLTKKNNNFYFTGKAKETANTATVAMASVMFGALGGAIAASTDKAMFEFLIDHTTGKFIPVKKVSD